jgi:hypothetical protein
VIRWHRFESAIPSLYFKSIYQRMASYKLSIIHEGETCTSQSHLHPVNRPFSRDKRPVQINNSPIPVGNSPLLDAYQFIPAFQLSHSLFISVPVVLVATGPSQQSILLLQLLIFVSFVIEFGLNGLDPSPTMTVLICDDLKAVSGVVGVGLCYAETINQSVLLKAENPNFFFSNVKELCICQTTPWSMPSDLSHPAVSIHLNVRCSFHRSHSA